MRKILCIICCSFFFSACMKPTSSIEMQYQVYEVKNGIEIWFDERAEKEIQEYYVTGSVVINGSYFGINNSWSYYPAWLWVNNGVISNPLHTDDPNLSFAVFLTQSGVSIIENSHTEGWIASCLAMTGCTGFQAGPLVLSGNVLQGFWKSWHANGKHQRTLLGLTNSGKVYIFVFPYKISLSEVWSIIQNDARFIADSLTLLNLDGWPSTAYYDGVHWFEKDKKLPIIFRIYR